MGPASRAASVTARTPNGIVWYAGRQKCIERNHHIRFSGIGAINDRLLVPLFFHSKLTSAEVPHQSSKKVPQGVTRAKNDRPQQPLIVFVLNRVEANSVPSLSLYVLIGAWPHGKLERSGSYMGEEDRWHS